MEVFEMLTAVEPSERCRLFFRIDMPWVAVKFGFMLDMARNWGP